MYLMADRRISFLDSFLSGGCVGTSLRSSANAPDTFCCRHRSRVLVNTFRTPPTPLPPLTPPELAAELPPPAPPFPPTELPELAGAVNGPFRE